MARTLLIIKPDAVAKNVIGEIYSRFEKAGLKIAAAKKMHLSEDQAKAFYAVHAERPFYGDLVKFMISGPVMVQVLEGEGAILKNRDIMGATNPAEAAEGTIRADFADSIDANAVHGSDAPETAAEEIKFFFNSGITRTSRRRIASGHSGTSSFTEQISVTGVSERAPETLVWVRRKLNPNPRLPIMWSVQPLSR